MNITKDSTIGDVVAGDYRTSQVFEKAGIDFCCKGNRSIEEACTQLQIETEGLISQLRGSITADSEKENGSNDFNTWPLDLLADYIEKKHHRYVSEKIPIILGYLDKILAVHGAQHPELAEIRAHFFECAQELSAHMKKEELILFPFIRKMEQAKQSVKKDISAHFGTVKNPIKMMMHEHDVEGERFSKINELSNQYTVPADGCNTYKATFLALKEFEADLHLHIHLENNILFPKSISLEDSFV